MDKDYIKMYEILEYCFDKLREDSAKVSTIGYSEYDCLAVLLGALSVDIFEDNWPADPAIVDKWTIISMNYFDVLEKTIALLDMYEKEFGFDFKNTKQLLVQPQSGKLKEILESQ